MRVLTDLYEDVGMKEGWRFFVYEMLNKKVLDLKQYMYTLPIDMGKIQMIGDKYLNNNKDENHAVTSTTAGTTTNASSASNTPNASSAPSASSATTSTSNVPGGGVKKDIDDGMDKLLEEFGDSSASMDDIVKGVMTFRLSLNYSKVKHIIEKQQRPMDIFDGDGINKWSLDRISSHFNSVEWMFTDKLIEAASNENYANSNPNIPEPKNDKPKDPTNDHSDSDSDDDTIKIGDGVEIVGDPRLIGKGEFTKRRKRCASLWVMKWSQEHAGSVSKQGQQTNNQSGKRAASKQKGNLRESVAHRALSSIIEETEILLKEQCIITQARVARDNLLMKNAFEREIRTNYRKLHGTVEAEADVVRTGDIQHLLDSRKEEQRNGVLNNNISKPVEPAATSFELKLKSEQNKGNDKGRSHSEHHSMSLEDAIITVSPNIGVLSKNKGMAKIRCIGQDVETDLFIMNLVNTVPYASLVEGFVSLENGSSAHSTAEKDMLPEGWWDRSRAYTALLHEARSLDRRRVYYDMTSRELRKKSAALTEAIDVVLKSAYMTGAGLQKMSISKTVVDSAALSSLKDGKAGVRRFERTLEANEETHKKTLVELKILEKMYSHRVQLEEAEEKERIIREHDEELRQKAAAAKTKGGGGKGSPKKNLKKTAPAPPPPRKKKVGEEEIQKKPEYMTSDELFDLIATVRDKAADLEKKHAAGLRNLEKFKEKVRSSEDNRANSDLVMAETVVSDFDTLNQLQTAIGDYENEKTRVDAEIKNKHSEIRSVSSQIEDVVYTAKLIAPEDAEPFEYKTVVPTPKQDAKSKHGHHYHKGKKKSDGARGGDESGRASPVAMEDHAKVDERTTAAEKSKDSMGFLEADKKKLGVAEQVGGENTSLTGSVDMAPVVSGASAINIASQEEPPNTPSRAAAGKPAPTSLEELASEEEKKVDESVPKAVSPAAAVKCGSPVAAAPNSPARSVDDVDKRVDPIYLDQQSLDNDNDFGSVTRFNDESSMEMGIGPDFFTPQESLVANSNPVADNNTNAPTLAPSIESASNAESDGNDDNTISTENSQNTARAKVIDAVSNAESEYREALESGATAEELTFLGDKIVEAVKAAEDLGIDEQEMRSAIHPEASSSPDGSSSRGRSPTNRFESVESLDSLELGSVASQTVQESSIEEGSLDEGSAEVDGGGGDDDDDDAEEDGNDSDETEQEDDDDDMSVQGFDEAEKNSQDEIAAEEEEHVPEGGAILMGAAAKLPPDRFNNEFLNSSKSNPTKVHHDAEAMELQNMYDQALAVLFKKERTRHRRALKEEARVKLAAEEEAKEAQRVKEENEAAKLASVGMLDDAPSSPPKALRRRSSSVMSDFKKISQRNLLEKRKNLGKSNDKKISSDVQFYEARDCHTMRKFIRKRNQKISDVQEKKAEALKNSHAGETFEDSEGEGVLTTTEEFEYANIGRIVVTNEKGEKVAVLREKILSDKDAAPDVGVELEVDEEFDEDEWEEDTGEGAWKASIATPFINPDELGKLSDEDTRQMMHNIGVSVSMEDEKTSTAKFLDTMGEARRKRANLESIRLKSNDQFMLIGHAQALLNQKLGGFVPGIAEYVPEIYEESKAVESVAAESIDENASPANSPLADRRDLVALQTGSILSSATKQAGRSPSQESGRKLISPPNAASVSSETFADGSSVASGGSAVCADRSLRASFRQQPATSMGDGSMLFSASRTSSASVSVAQSGANSVAFDPIVDNDGQELVKSTPPRTPVFAARPRTNTSIDRANLGSRDELMHARPRSVSQMREEEQQKKERAAKVEEVKHYSQSPLDADRVFVFTNASATNPNMIGMYQHYPLKENGFDTKPAAGALSAAAEEKADDENTKVVKDVTVQIDGVDLLDGDDPNEVKGRLQSQLSLRSKGGESFKSDVSMGKRSKLFVSGSSKRLIPDRPTRKEAVLEGESENNSLIDLGPMNISASVSLISNVDSNEAFELDEENSQEEKKEPGLAAVLEPGRDDEKYAVCDESVEDIMSTIMDAMEGSAKGGAAVEKKKEAQRLAKLKGSLHVGASGLKHKYANGTGVEPSPALTLDHNEVLAMKLHNSHSHHFGQPNIFPKVSDQHLQTTPASSRPTSSMTAGRFQSRMNTASSWNTISSNPNSRPATGMSSGGVRTRPSTGQQLGNIRISENSGVRMVRSPDGMEYVYKIYDEFGEGGEGGRKINTPAALPTEMLFDESGRVYGEVLSFDDDGKVVGEGDVFRAQTAGENMVRLKEADPLEISGRTMLKRAVGDNDEKALSSIIRPASSPTNLPSSAYEMSENDKMKAWRNFELKNMSTATEQAYALLLDEDDGALFGEDIEFDDDDFVDRYGVESGMALEEFFAKLQDGTDLKKDLEQLKNEGPGFLFGTYDDTEGDDSAVVKDGAEGEDGEIVDALKGAFATGGEDMSSTSPSLSVKISRIERPPDERPPHSRADSPENMTQVDEASYLAEALRGGDSLDSASYTVPNFNVNNPVTLESEVAIQDALKNFGQRLAEKDMEEQLVAFKDSILRNRLEEAKAISRLTFNSKPNSATIDGGGGRKFRVEPQYAEEAGGALDEWSNPDAVLEMQGTRKDAVADPKKTIRLDKWEMLAAEKRKALEFERLEAARKLMEEMNKPSAVVEMSAAPVEEKSLVSLPSEKDESSVRSEFQDEIDIGPINDIDLYAKFNDVADAPVPESISPVLEVEPEEEMKKYEWGRTASSPAALAGDEEWVKKFKHEREEMLAKTKTGNAEEKDAKMVGDGDKEGTSPVLLGDVAGRKTTRSHSFVFGASSKSFLDGAGDGEVVEESASEEKKETPEVSSNASVASSLFSGPAGRYLIDAARPITPSLEPKAPPALGARFDDVPAEVVPPNEPSSPIQKEERKEREVERLRTPDAGSGKRDKPMTPKTPELTAQLAAMSHDDDYKVEGDDESQSQVWNLEEGDQEMLNPGDPESPVPSVVGVRATTDGEEAGKEAVSEESSGTGGESSAVNDASSLGGGNLKLALELDKAINAPTPNAEVGKKVGSRKKRMTGAKSPRRDTASGGKAGGMSPRRDTKTEVKAETKVEARKSRRTTAVKKKKDGDSSNSSTTAKAAEEEEAKRVPNPFKKGSIVRVSAASASEEGWEKFGKKNVDTQAEDRIKRNYYAKKSRENDSKMHKTKRNALLGGVDEQDYDAVGMSDGESSDEGRPADPLDRKKKKMHTFKDFHVEEDRTQKHYFDYRRGPEIREKVRGKSHLKKEAIEIERKKTIDLQKREQMAKEEAETGMSPPKAFLPPLVKFDSDSDGD
jgi:hypothetical protein